MPRNIGPQKGPDGQTRIVRKKYRPEDYTVPQSALDDLSRWKTVREGFDTLLEMRDGPFPAYVEFERVKEGNQTWVVLRNSTYDYCIEVLHTRAGLGAIRPVPPERAYQIAKAVDAKRPQQVHDET